ncbi:Nucleolar and coiled-body phosphoprotein 1 [Oopsacas minuta]|uniref:Nucleolar and coiled-body phosphoprotein 1 n=1 Tax=Oopsacas minuta TaxID=111878 RepID=A0AAV7K412_9METZ|nr:Nucleolar and coiled-body phosphoprotein 1 [Oopsacas minuta]
MQESGLPSELLFGIYKFLIENDLKKSAKTLRKEVSLDVTNDSDVNLLELYRKFLKRKRKSLETEPSSKKKLKLSDEVLHTSEVIPTPLETDIIEYEESVNSFEKNAAKKQKKNKKNNNNVIDNSTVITNQHNYTGFRRVNTDISKVNPMLRDNSFAKKVSMGGSDKSWGKKACDDFRNTSGKTFRHEKTKKKRGSYRGGSIGTEVCSFKFDLSESDS